MPKATAIYCTIWILSNSLKRNYAILPFLIQRVSIFNPWVGTIDIRIHFDPLLSPSATTGCCISATTAGLNLGLASRSASSMSRSGDNDLLPQVPAMLLPGVLGAKKNRLGVDPRLVLGCWFGWFSSLLLLRTKELVADCLPLSPRASASWDDALVVLGWAWRLSCQVRQSWLPQHAGTGSSCSPGSTYMLLLAPPT